MGPRGVTYRYFPLTCSIKEPILRKLIVLCTALCAMVLLISAGPAQAQSILWVAPNGSDANVCSQVSPCATFSGTISKGGVAQINCLGSGNYGSLNGTTTVSISGSIIIDCGEGNVGEMTTGGGSAAINIVTAGAANITLRHLSLNGNNSPSTIGISAAGFNSGTLIVEDCMISGFAGSGVGIEFGPTGARGTLQVSRSLIANNGFGVFVIPLAGSGVASVVLNGVELVGNAGDGLVLQGAVVAGTLRNSLVAANGNIGVAAFSNQVFFDISGSSIIDNLSNGIFMDSPGSGSAVTVGGSAIAGNGTGVQSTAGALVSFGNNQLSANGSNGAFTGTIAQK
jgi:hypothetical protein